jgi:molybdopterin-guanine dinucleotide biosynthesis protein A
MLGMEDVAAYVIAGGRSSRMGRDKAFLSLHGTTLLERALAVARAATPQVTIVGPREKFAAYGNVVEDLYAGQGPLAGIHAALSSSASELNLVIGVDTPFLDPRFAQFLVEQARTSAAVVTFPVLNLPPRIATDSHGSNMSHSDPRSSAKIRGSVPSGQAQPLCAVYRREFAAVAEAALRQGRNAIVPLFAHVTVRQVGENEMRELAFDPRMFDNLNTPEEWDQACRRVQS